MQAEPHRWLFEHRGRKTWLPELIEVQEEVGSLSDTQLTLTLDQLTSEEGRFKPFLNSALPHVGCWIVPDHIGNGQRYRYVNPHSADSWLYGEGVVRCECGSLAGDFYTRPDQWASTLRDHNDSCTLEQVREARQRLEKIRRRIYVESVNAALPATLAARRAGMTTDDWLRWVSSKGLNWDEARGIGRLREVATWRVLRDVWDHTVEEIAAGFRTDTETVRLLLAADVDLRLGDQQ